MPIAQINDDGTVKIYNKLTNEIKDVQPNELEKFNPALITEYQKKLVEKQREQALLKLGQTQGIPQTTFDALIKSNPQTALKLQESNAKILTKEQEKPLAGRALELTNLGKSGLRTLEDVKKEYEKDPSQLTKQLIPGKFLSRKLDSAVFNTVDAILRIRTGAQAPENEIRSYMQRKGPVFGDSPEVVEYKLQRLQNDLRDAITEKGEKLEIKPIKLNVQSQKKTGNIPYDVIKQNPLLDFLLGESASIAKDIGTGIGQKRSGIQKAQNQLLDQAMVLSNKAALEKNPDKKKALFQEAQKLLEQTSKQAQEQAGEFSPDVQENPLLRAGLGASEIALAAEIPGITKGALSFGKKALHPFRTVGEMRAAKIAQASGKTIKGDILVKNLEKIRTQVPSTELPAFDTMLKNAQSAYKGKTISISDAVELNKHLNDAFTASGKVGQSAKALVEKVLGDAVKSQIKLTAPEVAKANQLFKLLYGARKTAAKYAYPAAVSAGAGAGGALVISKLFGGNQSVRR